MSKRKSDAIRPPKEGEWRIRHATTDAAKGWDELCRQQPGPIATLYDKLTADPRAVDNRDKQGRLKGALGEATIDSEPFEQWQYELAAGARVWFAPDDNTRTVWITLASTRHPNATK